MTSRIQVTLANDRQRGRQWEFEIEEASLGVRWWSWTEYGDGHWVDLPRGPEWIERAIATHRVLPLGYPEGGGGLLFVTEADQRFYWTSPISVFPITDDAIAIPGAAEFRASILARFALEPSLF